VSIFIRNKVLGYCILIKGYKRSPYSRKSLCISQYYHDAFSGELRFKILMFILV